MTSVSWYLVHPRLVVIIRRAKYHLKRNCTNATIYATILTGLGIVVTLIVTMHNLSKTNQQETNRGIDDLKKDLKELLDANRLEKDFDF